jgi:hypothetical protein
MIWFLVSIASGQYVGPMRQEDCLNAGRYILTYGIVCRQAVTSMACPVEGRPGTYQICPVFDDLPRVTVKP